MGEVNLLGSQPKIVRDVNARTQTKQANRELALKFGREYFDGAREQGYGGYRYDGRWIPVAKRIVQHFGLKPGDRVLDVGCAKAFLVKDLLEVCPGLEVYGLDVSTYALSQAPSVAANRLVRGSADALPFPDKSFAAVLSINTIHNLDRAGCLAALREMERLAPGRGFVQVDAYRNEVERALFEDWMLTAKTYCHPAAWLELFAEARYTGDYFWTILAADTETVVSRHLK